MLLNKAEVHIAEASRLLKSAIMPRLGQGAYSLELEMVPSFISLELARKILLAGSLSTLFVKLQVFLLTPLDAVKLCESVGN